MRACSVVYCVRSCTKCCAVLHNSISNLHKDRWTAEGTTTNLTVMQKQRFTTGHWMYVITGLGHRFCLIMSKYLSVVFAHKNFVVDVLILFQGLREQNFSQKRYILSNKFLVVFCQYITIY